MKGMLAIGCGLLWLAWQADGVAANPPAKKAQKDKFDNVTKIIPKKAFEEAIIKLAKDERVPVASSTLVEKGRGEDYYSVEKMFDNNPDTFWAEGAKGIGKNEWVTFHLPEETTHVEITPGAGREQFSNFNRPKMLFLDVYLVKLKQEEGEYKPNFRWLGRTVLEFKEKGGTVRGKLPVKLPELSMAVRTLYLGVVILQDVFKGQFDDTSIAEIKTSSVWGEQ